MLANLLGVAAIAASFTTGIITYIIWRREHSGDIGSSEASILWAQITAYSNRQAADNEILRRRIDKLEEANRLCEREVERLNLEVRKLTRG